MIMLKLIRAFVRRSDGPPNEQPDKVDRSWSLSARLASVPDFYTMIVPSDLADLVREAKQLHPEVAHHASRRDQAVMRWVDRARPAQRLP